MSLEQMIMDFFSSPWAHLTTSVVTTASLLANITPDKTDNAIIRIIKVVLDSLALNFRKSAK